MRALVTGGGGFLGRAITARLLDRGDPVTILARSRHPQVEALGAHAVQADLRDAASLDGVLRGMDLVFHVASKTGVYGPRDEFMAVNVDGTRNLLSAARSQGVRRLVYTSSPSCVHGGADEEGVSEDDCPYPTHFESAYPQSKAMAEQLVLAANCQEFATTALRPHLIYGPGEPHMLPRLMDRHAKGRLRRIGDGTNRVGLTYIDNAALAHLQAADVLAPGSTNAGRAYFITDAQPVALWPWIDQFMQGVGLAPLPGSVPLGLVKVGAGLMEWAWRRFDLEGEPPMTRFAATQLAT
ncbi:MAG: NAD-dependent epimerase/dehydratase family protein, partial [Oligoflexia bacterium]|nr:NAD-dependent epimerase/dehydratase family protein [Oligoflexia bacterium]